MVQKMCLWLFSVIISDRVVVQENRVEKRPIFPCFPQNTLCRPAVRRELHTALGWNMRGRVGAWWKKNPFEVITCPKQTIMSQFDSETGYYRMNFSSLT